jgi:hypothetical protein
MRGAWPALTALACALALAGCAEPKPFLPSPVRIGRTHFAESAETPGPEKIRLTLSRDTLQPWDALVATIDLAPSLLSRQTRLRIEVFHGEPSAQTRCDRVDLTDIRNTRIDVRVDLREAPLGRYVLRVNVDSLAVESAFSVQE